MGGCCSAEAIDADEALATLQAEAPELVIDGEVVPGTHAAEDEIFGLAKGLGELGQGIVELAPAGVQGEDMSAPEREIEWMGRLSGEVGRPVTFALVQHDVGGVGQPGRQ